MTISDVSIRKPLSVLMLTLTVLVLGIFFLNRLSVDLLPNIIYPKIRIIVKWKGASPQEIEENIVKKIEPSVATTEDSILVISSSIEGDSLIEVYFEFGKNMDVALADTRAKLDLVRKDLPMDIEEPMIFKADPSQLPILDIAIYSKTKDERWLRWWAENDLANHFLGIPGLGAVVASGGKEREIQVIFNNQKLQNYELSTAKVLEMLRSENIDSPAGLMTANNKDFSVRLLSKFNNTSEIENVILLNNEGRVVKIKDVAKVIDIHEEQRVITRFNQAPCVLLSFMKQPTANTVEVASNIEKKARELKSSKIIPDDIDFKVASSQAYYIQTSINNVGTSAVIGGICAMIIILLFLHSIKRTLVIAVAIPISILASFILLGLADVTLNMFSLGGLVLAVGMLVDNSIVMLENITRHQKQHSNSVEASRKGSREIMSALFASTLTTLSAIIPFFFIKGLSALLFRDMVVTIIAALIVSLLISFTVVPAIAAHFFKSKDNEPEDMEEKFFMRGVIKVYHLFLERALRYRTIVIFAAAILLIAGLFMMQNMGRIFLPQIDDGRVTVKMKMPVGTPLNKTNAAAKKIEQTINSMPGVMTVYTMVGGYWKSKNVYEKANEMEITIQLVEKQKRPFKTKVFMKKLQKNLKALASENFSSANIKVIPSRLRGIMKISTSDIDIRLIGPDIELLYEVAAEIEKKIKNVPGVMNPDISLDMSRPEIHVLLNRQKLSDYGLTAKNVSDVLRTSIYGQVDTYFTDKNLDMDFPIRLIRDLREMKDIRAVEDILLYPQSGVELRLKEVATVIESSGPVQIDRKNQVRFISVTADAGDRNAGLITKDIKKILTGITLPANYRIEYGGEDEAASESSGQLFIVILLGLFLVFVVMTVQYESLIDPIVIMTTAPLAVIGAFSLIAVTNTPFSSMVFLGLILLVGIVVNNAIIMVEFINEKKKEKGIHLTVAITSAAVLRLRPILMTTITTSAGVLPLALGWGEGLEMLQPLAITIIGGLASSTLLTLFVIPCVYSVMRGR